VQKWDVETFLYSDMDIGFAREHPTSGSDAHAAPVIDIKDLNYLSLRFAH